MECSSCCGDWSSEARVMAYRSVPWMGIYISNLKRTHRKLIALIFAVICFFIITYMFYGVLFTIWEEFFFDGRPYMTSYGQTYYLYLELLEFLILIFIRSRISILYFPKIISLVNLSYLFYGLSNFFPFFELAVGLMIVFTIVIFLLFIKYSELPAANINPFVFHT